MMFWIFAALLTAAATGPIAGPLMQRQGRTRIAFIVMFFLPLAALTLYLFTGNPHMLD